MKNAYNIGIDIIEHRHFNYTICCCAEFFACHAYCTFDVWCLLVVYNVDWLLTRSSCIDGSWPLMLEK